MPFNRPTLQDLNDRTVANISTRLPGADAGLRRTNTKAFSAGLAGLAHGLYAHQQWIADQLFPDLADEENVLRHAAIRGLVRKGSAKATGSVDFTGDVGAVIAAGAALSRADGFEFVTLADITLVDGTGTGDVTAVLEGDAGNSPAGTSLSFTAPLPDVDSSAAVDASGLVNGVDLENLEALRSRVLSVWRQPPQGGAGHDYVHWALAVDGVTRAWVYPGELGAGTVTVRYVRDDELDIFPDAAHVALVQAYIEERRPITAEVTVVSPVAVDLDLTINIDPLSEAVKTAVTNELNDLLTRNAKPGATIYISQIREAVSIAAGERNNAVISPAADVIYAVGQMPRLGNITWGVVV